MSNKELLEELRSMPMADVIAKLGVKFSGFYNGALAFDKYNEYIAGIDGDINDTIFSAQSLDEDAAPPENFCILEWWRTKKVVHRVCCDGENIQEAFFNCIAIYLDQVESGHPTAIDALAYGTLGKDESK